MRNYLIAGNWKMNNGQSSTGQLINEIKSGIGISHPGSVEILVCPPAISIETALRASSGSVMKVGAQNCHFEPKGAFTGELSVGMIAESGCTHVIIGHSERRTYFLEDDKIIAKKVSSAFAGGLIPILCIGETLSERQAGKTFDILSNQLDEDLSAIPSEEISKLVIAYEPVWAIGTGISATNEQVAEAHAWIRDYLVEHFNAAGEDILILYGGSLNDKNAPEILGIKNVDGGLIGGASLKSEIFLSIINTAISLSGS
jgi:triosephosphate isomerase (TIM)